jgi:hypothetical protein
MRHVEPLTPMTCAAVEATLARFDHLVEQVDACLGRLRRRERLAARVGRARRESAVTSAA